VKEVNLSQDAFYYHFESKEDVLVAILEKNVSAMESALRQTADRTDLDEAVKLNAGSCRPTRCAAFRIVRSMLLLLMRLPEQDTNKAFVSFTNRLSRDRSHFQRACFASASRKTVLLLLFGVGLSVIDWSSRSTS
jgi:AcrR family transcriptional regulator